MKNTSRIFIISAGILILLITYAGKNEVTIQNVEIQFSWKVVLGFLIFQLFSLAYYFESKNEDKINIVDLILFPIAFLIPVVVLIHDFRP